MARTLSRGSYQRLAANDALWRAWRQCRRGKRGSAAVAGFEIDCDRHLLALARDLAARRYRPAPCRLHTIRDPKPRLIAAPAVRDRVVHHALLNEIGPVFERSFIDHSFSAGLGRGPQRAVLHYLGCQRRFGWRLQLDIAGYFPAIDHARLLALFRRRVADPDTLALISDLLVAGGQVYRHPLAVALLGSRCPPPGRGLPLGSWFSQWCGNFYLDELDQRIKRQHRIAGYLRYMDDFVLFGDDPARLADIRDQIAGWLDEARGLALNPKQGAIAPTRSPGQFVGYRISRAGIAPSRKLRRRLPAKLASAAAQGEDALARTLASYRGLLVFP